MRPSLLLLLLLLMLLSLGSSTSTFVGCGTGDVNGFAAFGCSGGGGDDPCDYIVTLGVTVLDSGDFPVPGATVTIDSNPPDSAITDPSGQVFWKDTSFLTGYSANCDGEDVGTVEPYDSDTAFTWDVIVTASGFAPANTFFTINRQTRDVELTVRLGL